MKKIFVSLFIGLVLGAFGGFAVGIFVYPFLFLDDIVATEQLSDVDSRTLVASGSFIHADPKDPVHFGRGGVNAYADALHLQDDFRVGPGPAYHVYLVPAQSVTPETDVAATMFVDLGRLRAFKGSQVYPIPPGVALADYPYVVIWCRQFGVLISPARLQFL